MTKNKPKVVTAYQLQVETIPDGREIIRLRNADGGQILAVSAMPNIPLEEIRQRFDRRIKYGSYRYYTEAQMSFLFVETLNRLPQVSP